ncbi:hypothetical protein FZC79_07625 [Rossellomorea vietnamensis]|uniref:Lipoprotein n=1 Tax=Rossellomorea vietnamensis TaxID=218284 RepID=A0A5D4KFC2_9BACI|nr:hypothetical protein [Rossellomorea vietnamensis]TYR76014.1 hypothetical protein FZC79_07625 [Rossellomorea vietnamensis]
MKKLAMIYFLNLILLTGCGLMYSNNNNAPNKEKDEDLINHSITIYSNGKELTVEEPAEILEDLKVRIEDYAYNSDDSYKLLIGEAELEDLKLRGESVELIYLQSKLKEIKYIKEYFGKEAIEVKMILIPLSESILPNNSVVIYTAENEKYILANTKEEKQQLKEIIRNHVEKSKH